MSATLLAGDVDCPSAIGHPTMRNPRTANTPIFRRYVRFMVFAFIMNENQMHDMPKLIQTSARVGIRRPSGDDRDVFLAMVHASRELHRPWVDPPDSAERFAEYLQSRQGPGDDGFLICARDTGASSAW